MSEPVLTPHEALCEALLVLDKASDIGVEVGPQADVLLRLLGEYGFALAPAGMVKALDALTSYAERHGVALAPGLVRDALSGSLAASDLGL